jgi:hypothetical protein
MRFVPICVLLVLCPLAFGAPKSVPICKVKIQVAYLDRLNNMNLGIPKDSQKDVEKRLSKFGDVCYAGDGNPGDLVMFIHTSPATYQGHHVYTNTSNSAAAAASDGSAAAAAASSTSTTVVPYSVDYSVFILDIELPLPDNKFRILHTVDQKGLYNTIYGIGYGKGKHPIPNAIEAAAKWIHDEYLGSGSQSKW